MTRAINIADKNFAGLRKAEEAKPMERSPAAAAGSGPLAALGRQLTGKAVAPKHLLVITSQLAVMLASGCDLVAGLDAISRQDSHKYLKSVTLDLRDSVRNGSSFSKALSKYPNVFNPLYVTMMRAGETAGLMKSMLQSLQIIIRNQMRIGSSIRSALMYPCILMGVALSAIVVMTTFVLPRFAGVFKSSNVPLPLPTVIVLNTSEYVGAHWYWFLGGFIALALSIIYAVRHPVIKPMVDRWILKVPLLGPTIVLSNVCRSIQTIGMLTKSGLPLADTLVLTRDMMGNTHYWNFFNKLHTNISEGKQLSTDFDNSTLFPAMAAQMIAVGEQTGTLPAVCLEVASFHEEEMQNRIKVLTTAIEPIIIVMLGGFVGFIAVSVILPMFKIASAVH